MKKIFISLGSNVGSRQKILEEALFSFQQHDFISIEKVSSFYESTAWGKIEQDSFLNAVLEATTLLSPHELLESCQTIERDLGRSKKSDFGPRCIDLDILFYGEEVVCEETLLIPHPLLHERHFVLKGLKEISPEFQHPILSLSVSELYEKINLNGI